MILGARINSDETDGLAAYYRGAFFQMCEFCGRPGLVDGIVCESCAPLVNASAPEAHFREPDLSDVVRILAELRA